MSSDTVGKRDRVTVLVEAGKLEISVKLLGKDAELFEIGADETVGDLKNLIQERLAVKPVLQKLLYQKMPLNEDSYTLGALNIGASTALTLLVDQPEEPDEPEFTIVVQTLKGTSVTVPVSANMPIVEVSKRIEERTNISPRQHRLIFAKRHMMPGTNLSEFGVQEDSVVRMI